MQNLAANFPQLSFLPQAMSSSGGTTTNGHLSTSSTSATGSNTVALNNEQGRPSSGFDDPNNDQQTVNLFGMDANGLVQMMAAGLNQSQGNPLHSFYLSQLNQAAGDNSLSNNNNNTPTNPTPNNENDCYTNSMAVAAQHQQLLEQIFGGGLSSVQESGSNSEGSKCGFHTEQQASGNENGPVTGFGDLNPSEIAQIMANLISNNGSGGMTAEQAMLLSNISQNEQKITQGKNGQPVSQSPSQPVSPNAHQQQLFDQLQLINLLGGGNAAADLFAEINGRVSSSSTSQFPTMSSMNSSNNNNNPLSQLGAAGPDFAQLAASLGLGGGSSGMDALNHNQAAALLAASSGPFSFTGGSPNKSLDSYCELCDKNLCNRYFLKTHRLKKHGISDDGSNGSPVKGNFDSFNSSANQQPSHKTSSVIVNSSNGGGFGGEANNRRADSAESSPLAKMPKLSTSSIASSTGGAGNNMMANLMGPGSNMAHLFGNGKMPDFLSSFPSMMAGKLGEVEQKTPTKSPPEEQATFNLNDPSNGSNACDYCDKEFDSRINLLQHQILQHGGSSISSHLNQQSASPLSSVAATHGSSGSDPNLNGSLQSQINATNFLSNLLPGGLQLPFMLPSQLAAQFGGGGDLTEAQAALAKLNQLSGVAGGNAISSPNPQSEGQAKLVAKRQYSSTSKNYCDLCKKEVCNKYFLRTHMLKMHNIVIDENKSVIANIDTLEKEKSGSISFRCDICMQELKTRDDLRNHKKDNHGVLPLLTPPVGHGGSTTPRTPKSSTTHNNGPNSAHHLGHGLSSLTEPQQRFHQHFFGSSSEENDGHDSAGKKNDDGEDEGVGTSSTQGSKLDANLELILNSLASCRPLPINIERVDSAGRAGANKADGSSAHEDANSLDNNIPSSSASSTFEVPNSATSSASSSSTFKCRFCGDVFPDELKMQLHSISTHSTELFSQAFSGSLNFLGAAGQNMPVNDENDVIITRVALQMAQANQALSQSNKSAKQAGAPNPQPFICTHCSRNYKSKLSLGNHVRSVHHNLVAKFSPTKRHKRPVISPKKVKKLLSCFTCMKCQRRFSTRVECSEHVIGHLKAEKEQEDLGEQRHPITSPTSNDNGPAEKKPKMTRSSSVDNTSDKHQDSNNNSALHGCRSFPTQQNQDEDMLRSQSAGAQGTEQLSHKTANYGDLLELNAFIREDTTLGDENHHLSLDLPLGASSAEPTSSGSSGAMSFDDDTLLLIDENCQEGQVRGHDVVNQVVSEIHEEQCRRAVSTKDEKHSHTSGSASPLSVNVLSAGSQNNEQHHQHLPEAYAQPISSSSTSSSSNNGNPNKSHTNQPYTLQSFLLKTVTNNNCLTDKNSKEHDLLFNELLAYLPVKACLQSALTVTFELHPQTEKDGRVQHL